MMVEKAAKPAAPTAAAFTPAARENKWYQLTEINCYFQISFFYYIWVVG
jgi:hypothetical protein